MARNLSKIGDSIYGNLSLIDQSPCIGRQRLENILAQGL